MAWKVFGVTIFLYVLAWLGAYYSFIVGNKVLFPLFVVATSAMLLRTFIIQHDVGHYAFFKTRKYNTYAGRVCSVLTLTPWQA